MNLNWLRYALFAAIFAVSYILFLKWNAFQEGQQSPRPNTALVSISEGAVPTVATAGDFPPGDEGIPSIRADIQETTEIVSAVETPSSVHVLTDTLDVLIDSTGGDIVRISLPKHLAKLDAKDAGFVLLDRSDSTYYIAQSGLGGPQGTDKSGLPRPRFSVEKSEYHLADNSDTLLVDMHLQQDEVSITKRFTFRRDSYLIGIEYLINNQSQSNWQAALYAQIRRDDSPVKADTGIGMKPFLGAAITTPEKHYSKMSFEDIDDKDCDFGIENPCSISQQGGWVALVQHYFISAWIPPADAQNQFNIYRLKSTGLYVLETVGAVKTVAAGEQGSLSTSFYAGPKNIHRLENIAPYLDLTLDFSWLWMVAKPLHLALLFIQGFVSNWGLSIILLTLCVKLIFFYPSAISYRSMAKMRKLTPQMQELKEQYGEDKQRMSMEVMKLYRKEKVSPFGGCLPIMLQMPVFVALYWTLMESVELRHAPFMLWIQDLSVKDPFFILPLIMGVTMFIQQKLNPTPPDPMQAKVMQMMPIFFTALFLMFPAGLVLYWVVNNTLSIAQQYVITKRIEKATS